MHCPFCYANRVIILPFIILWHTLTVSDTALFFAFYVCVWLQRLIADFRCSRHRSIITYRSIWDIKKSNLIVNNWTFSYFSEEVYRRRVWFARGWPKHEQDAATAAGRRHRRLRQGKVNALSLQQNDANLY